MDYLAFSNLKIWSINDPAPISHRFAWDPNKDDSKRFFVILT